ncbi:hypothetical protein HYPSUDRAFT_33935 [Hypholoma sublateritium FD-334 SS-4]|uniref:Copper homeostasis protein cutC homolog n=1 Tax=Hypholoma sublateritium (strain FD-334 SS-4) TaxID=945553 RepID=A0A0D2LKZ6_HYPSF|nr:hypothetical protein HYPSUDRAFT_33935 [Hypholoma sublateritium FD-334 SS-4]
MVEDIRAFKEAGGVRGFVVGTLTKDGRVDIESMKILVDEILPLEVCFHRAFDMTQDPIEAMADITNIGGISRILTSGQRRSAPQGLAIIKKLLEERNMLVGDMWGLTIMPGSGINGQTLPPLLEALLPVGLREIHLSGGKWVIDDIAFKRDDMGMGIDRDTEWGVWRTQEEQVRQVRELCDSLWAKYVATVAK